MGVMNDSEKLAQVTETLSQRIYFVRGKSVMLDFDLAELYGVSTKRLNEQLKRNLQRFPPDFAFQLKYQEVATSSLSYGGHRELMTELHTPRKKITRLAK